MINIFLILIFLIGIIIGYKYGAHVIIYSFILLFVSMIVSSFISKYACDFLYKFLPFFNLNGKSMGLKSLNILIYRVVIYIFLLLLVIVLIDTLSNKLKIKDKLIDHMVEASKISQIVGAVTSLFLSFIVAFNILLIIGLPNINIKNVNGKYVDIIYNKVPFASKNLKNVYDSYESVKDLVNSSENNKKSYKQVNESIIDILVQNEVISEDKINDLDNKLVGTKNKKVNNTTTKKDDEDDDDDPGSDWEDDYPDDDSDPDWEDDYSDENPDNGYYDDDYDFEFEYEYPEDDGEFFWDGDEEGIN